MILTYGNDLVGYGGDLVDYGAKPRTVRFKFSNESYDPNSETWKTGAVWTRVSSNPNVWDYTRDATRWTAEFNNHFVYVNDPAGRVEVVDADFSGITSAPQIFLSCKGLVGVKRMRNTDGLEDFYSFFYGCSSLEYVEPFDIGADLTGFYGGDYLFAGCSSLSRIPELDFSRLKRGVYMFSNCSSITELPSTFTTANYTAGYGMFAGCTNLRSIPDTLDTSKMNYLASLFTNCASLTSVPYVSTAALMRSSSYSNLVHSMFAGCSSLLHAPENFDTTNAKGIWRLFKGCSSLQEVPLLNTAYLTNMEEAFSGCVSVESGALALYTQASTQSNPPTNYADCFKDCGKDTVTGAAELAQIPTSWGGTMTDNEGYGGEGV